MTNETVETDHYEHHGWPIRVVCEFQAADGQFAARSYVKPGGQAERATPGPASLAPSSSDAKARALKAAKRYIDGILVD